MRSKSQTQLRGNLSRSLSVFAFVFSMAATSAFAQDADTRRLNERIIQLEKKLASIEAALERAEKRANGEAPASSRRNGNAGGNATQVAAGRGETQGGQGDGRPQAPPGEQSSTVVQESFLVRDNVPTLSRNKFEMSQGFDYGRGTSILQNDRFFRATTTVRYGLTSDIEFSLSLPYYSSRRTTQAFSETIVRNVSGVGDVSMQVSANVLREGDWYPGAAVTVGMSIPTGDAPYDLGSLKAGNPPENPLALIQSAGHWVSRAAVQFFKTTDPLILYWGAGVEYAVPRTFGGIKIEPGLRYTYNMGIGFALSDRSTLGVAFNGALQERKKVDKQIVKNSVAESLAMRLTLIQRVGTDFWIEPAVAIGLTDDTPDAAVSLTLRKRF
jgi:hypothetical protein